MNVPWRRLRRFFFCALDPRGTPQHAAGRRAMNPPWAGPRLARRALVRRGLPPELASRVFDLSGYDTEYRLVLLQSMQWASRNYLLRHYPLQDLRHAAPLIFGSA